MYRFEVIKEKVKGQIFGTTYIGQTGEMLQFSWQLS